MNTSKPFQVLARDAEKIRTLIETRGGVHLWDCLDLSNASKTWFTPAHDATGQPTGKPHWSAGKILRTVTALDEVEVLTPKLIRRFHVGVKRGYGLTFVVTDAGTRRIHAAVENANLRRPDNDAWYEFDYEQQDALIFVPGAITPLATWQSEAA